MDAKLNCCAYPFLTETSLKCDYEIMTDTLSSLLGVCEATSKHIPELQKLVELTYHMNGSIRAKMALTADDLEYMLDTHDKYAELVSEQSKKFVLPRGCIGASHMHVARAKAKEVARLMYKIEREEQEVDKILIDFVNVLSNALFYMAMFENKMEGIDEIEFISKSYVTN
jgi:ATP:cob(I)alamin adenosyltransferase